ncbi:hypothetical protein [Massilia sp. CCM 8734]|uniref:hypothetical protein n=1 Tax=Massilia sp. CCM 8734 TaxID=2609283 RepID=UPI00142371EE|nr:hypothetical protein [Massilia sp. CCM 8734]NIA00225.1 hypothetical protein [Massilia sp. CCM 8734]
MKPLNEQYLTQGDDDLFGPGVCSACGKHGFHLACEAWVVELVRRFAENDRLLLGKHALHRAYGVAGRASRQCLDRVVAALAAYLKCPSIAISRIPKCGQNTN